MSSATLAIVDDDKPFAEYLQTLLRSRGYDTATYDSGDALLAALREGALPDVILLDVREDDEFKAGHIPGAEWIPLGQLSSRLGELPKDKRIVAHCATGVRAEMAYHKLKDKGYNVAFVKGDIAIDKAGKLTIAPN